MGAEFRVDRFTTLEGTLRIDGVVDARPSLCELALDILDEMSLLLKALHVVIEICSEVLQVDSARQVLPRIPKLGAHQAHRRAKRKIVVFDVRAQLLPGEVIEHLRSPDSVVDELKPLDDWADHEIEQIAQLEAAQLPILVLLPFKAGTQDGVRREMDRGAHGLLDGLAVERVRVCAAGREERAHTTQKRK